MEPFELLRMLVAALERLGLDYLVTGSMATIAYGEPRLTNDLDVVVSLPMERVEAFCAEFPAQDFYLSHEQRMAKPSRTSVSLRRAGKQEGELEWSNKMEEAEPARMVATFRDRRPIARELLRRLRSYQELRRDRERWSRGARRLATWREVACRIVRPRQ